MRILLATLFLMGCVPQTTEPKCATGEVFSASARACVASSDNNLTNSTPQNGADQSVSISEDATTVTFTLNASLDDDSDPLQYVLVTPPTQGVISNCLDQVGSTSTDDRTCTYTKTVTDFAGTDSFTYRVFDGRAYSLNSTVFITVSASEDAPTVAGAASISGTELTSTTSGSTYFTSSAIVIDEGGGVDENTQEICLQVVSNNVELVPQANVRVSYNGAQLALDSNNAVSLSDGSESAGIYPTYFEVTPAATENDGSLTDVSARTLTVSVYDSGYSSGSGCSGTADVTFTVPITIAAVNNPPVITGSTSTPLPSVSTVENNNVPTTTELTYDFSVDEGGGSDENAENVTIYVCSGTDVLTLPCYDPADTNEASLAGGSILPNLGVTNPSTEGISIQITNSGADYNLATADAGPANAYIIDDRTPGASSGTAIVRLTFDPASSQNGVEYVRVDAVDSGGNVTSNTFSVTVTAVNDLPEITQVSAPNNLDEDYTLSASTQTIHLRIDEGNATQNPSDENSQTFFLDVCGKDGTVAAPPASCTGNTEYSSIPDSSFSVFTGTSFATRTQVTVNGSGKYPIGTTADDSATNVYIVVTPPTNVHTVADPNNPVFFWRVEVQDSASATVQSVLTGDIDEINSINDAPTITTNLGAVPPNLTTNTGTTIENATLYVDEGGISGAGAGTEDTDDVLITVTSSNTTLLPNNHTNIKLVYGTTELSSATAPNLYTTGYDLSGVSGGAGDEKALPLYFTFKPVAGQTGTSTITVTLNDQTGGVNTTSTTTFDINVNSNVAVHNGWTKIQALGRTVDRDGSATANATVTLSWNAMTLTTGTGATISGYQVYRSLQVGTWGLIGTTNSSTLTYTDTITATGLEGDEVYYRVHAIESVGSTSVQPTQSFSEVRVVIPEDNTVFVSRRMANKALCELQGLTPDKELNNRCLYDGARSINLGANFIDIGADYFVERYEAGFPYTADTDSTRCSQTGTGNCIGKLDPTTTCPVSNTGCQNSTGAFAISCNTGVTGSPITQVLPTTEGLYYWDNDNQQCYISDNIDNAGALVNTDWVLAPTGGIVPRNATGDLLYMRDSNMMFYNNSGAWQLLGCPYEKTIAKCGNGANKSCRGDDNVAGLTATEGGIYYFELDASTCSRSRAAGTYESFYTLDDSSDRVAGSVTDWQTVAAALGLINTTKAHRRPGNPPIVNIDADDASSFCGALASRVIRRKQVDGSYVNATTNATWSLPQRDIQVVSALWDSATADTTLQTLEAGTSLGASSQCNSTSGGSLGYSTDAFPLSAATLPTLPATSNNIFATKTVTTGSSSTASCQSIWGVQDLVGNVREWSVDTFDCDSSTQCAASSFSVGSTAAPSIYALASGASEDGPYCDNSGGDCGSAPAGTTTLTEWSFGDTSNFGATHFYVLAALPSKNSGAYSSPLLIGTNIATSKFRGDVFRVNASAIQTATDDETAIGGSGALNEGRGNITFGGAFDDGDKAGAWTGDVIDFRTMDNKTGFRCVSAIPYVN